MVRVAIEGCCHGELDKIYSSLKHIETKERVKIDLLIICGDFQSLRNYGDLDQMAVPEKHKKLGIFHEYYSGKKTAPILTVFIGGNHEGSNYLWELYHGSLSLGWVCPNIYFLGFAGVVNFGGLRIAGLTGIFDPKHYNLGYHEVIPLNREQCRSIYHVRRYNEYRVSQLTNPIDIFVSHDWPRGIYHYGDKKRLLSVKSFFEHEVNTNTLGSQVNERLLYLLKPRFWFSAHLHVKFAALVNHSLLEQNKAKAWAPPTAPPARPAQVAPVPVVNPDAIDIVDSDDEAEGEAVAATEKVETAIVEEEKPVAPKIVDVADTQEEPAAAGVQEQATATEAEEPQKPKEPQVTRFLALDKCLPRRDFLQVLDIDAVGEGKEAQTEPKEAVTHSFEYDEEWLAIVRATYDYLSLQRNQVDLPDQATIKERIRKELEWVKENISSKEDGLVVPRNFVMTAPPHLPSHGHRNIMALGQPVQNPQTVAFCEKIGLPNKINSTYEVTTYVEPPPPVSPPRIPRAANVAPIPPPGIKDASDNRGLNSLPPRPALSLPEPKFVQPEHADGKTAEIAEGNYGKAGGESDAMEVTEVGESLVAQEPIADFADTMDAAGTRSSDEIGSENEPDAKRRC
ncbi:hypothetical protein CcCBS67573_g03647 [Chytriomyces confervae]|uniref:Lariat debranching enzyme C-terminal domain-containing protein n=1 Tax=Chytriomyces confervae TaxID=246404 RepID=A0A507FG13_9FUNG|nr:hypothetical protein CcCBS67573_g03647 [Chytriomyces confervae]